MVAPLGLIVPFAPEEAVKVRADALVELRIGKEIKRKLESIKRAVLRCKLPIFTLTPMCCRLDFGV